MSLKQLMNILSGRASITVSRRTPAGGLVEIATGRLEHEDDDVLLVASGGALHRIHRHPGLVIQGGGQR